MIPVIQKILESLKDKVKDVIDEIDPDPEEVA